MGEFRGFVVPTATPVPDQFFDELLPVLNLAETRVLLVIIRCTYGSRRPSADLSLRQIMEGVSDAEGYPVAPPIGLSKATVCRALAALRRRRIIIAQRQRSAERGNEPTVYRLNAGVFL
jgi:transcription initiation factor IIE alpha subunit